MMIVGQISTPEEAKEIELQNHLLLEIEYEHLFKKNKQRIVKHESIKD